jgi:hypothetical protein
MLTVMPRGDPENLDEIPTLDQFVSTAEVMKIFQKDRATVLRWARPPDQRIRIAGKLPGGSNGPRSTSAVLFDRASVQAEAKRQADVLRRQAEHLEERAAL